jgi:hypothetical protein
MLKYPKPRYDHHYLVPQQRIPGYLPYPNPVSPGNIPVPNASSIDWPQAQFAPKFFPAGSKSFQPYRYPDYQHDVDLGGLYEEGTEFAEDNPLYSTPPRSSGWRLLRPSGTSRRRRAGTTSSGPS